MENEIIFLVNFVSLSSFILYITHLLFISKDDIQQKCWRECEHMCGADEKTAKAQNCGNIKQSVHCIHTFQSSKLLHSMDTAKWETKYMELTKTNKIYVYVACCYSKCQQKIFWKLISERWVPRNIPKTKTKKMSNRTNVLNFFNFVSEVKIVTNERVYINN